MAVVVYPLSVRKAVLRCYVDGMLYKDISKMHGPSPQVIKTWVDQSGLVRNKLTTDAEIDAALASKAEEIRTMQAQAEQRGEGKISKKRKLLTDQKYGPPPAKLSGLKGPTDIEGYNQMIEESLEHVAANLQRETSLEGKAKAIMLGTLFMQLKASLNNPLVMITVADQERVFNQVQKLLGMNDDKKGGNRRIDISILNARVEQPKSGKGKPKVYEAQIIKKDEPVGHLPGPSLTEVVDELFDVDNFEV